MAEASYLEEVVTACRERGAVLLFDNAYSEITFDGFRGSKKDEVPIPMCGVPHHSVGTYTAKLLGAGFKVALCDQMEEASAGKKLVERRVVRVVTPGTVTEEEYLDPKKPNYLVAVRHAASEHALVWVDLSTGELRRGRRSEALDLCDLLAQLAPREVLVESGAEDLAALVGSAVPDAMISRMATAAFDAAAGSSWMSEAGSAEVDSPVVYETLAALLSYLRDTHRASLDHIRPAGSGEAGQFMVIDEATRRNLELLTTTRGERRGSLLSVLDETDTPMGGRLLRGWLLAPLTEANAIGARLDAVEEMLRDPARRATLRTLLSGIGDLERLTARLASGRVSPRDLLGLAAALEAAGKTRQALAGVASRLLQEAAAQLDDLPDSSARITATINQEVPLKPGPGTLIVAGCDARADELRDLARSGKSVLTQIEARERARTGISSLKVRYNKVFGYYLEVTKANLHLVPQDYRRKQTTANAERFVTDELETYEARVLGAEEKLAALEQSLFEDLLAAVAARHAALSGTARALALIDVFLSLATTAERHHYARPVLRRDRRIAIEQGRHPVVEVMAGREGFVANDCLLDPDEEQILILTGPNMAGKSTYLRQVALITLLAQVGSFVPAASAEIGVVDRLFTRIGASDNLAGGESTFMVEMKETANILCQLSARSLAILDEIGRGTSTFDGISIAWAVAEHLHDDEAKRPLVLFATHYHELTDLARTKERVRNFSVAVREWKGDVLFLRRVRFEREAKVLASLNHPNIAAVYGLHEAGTSTGSVLVPRDGAGARRGSRASACSGAAPPVEETLKAARQIARGDRSRGGRDPSRSQTGQRQGRPRRRGQGARLRPGQGAETS